MARTALFSLYRAWSGDHEGFASALAVNPALQRRYLWLVKGVEAIKPGLNLKPEEAAILADLVVDCGDEASM